MFGIIPATHPLITQPTSSPTPTSSLYTLPPLGPPSSSSSSSIRPYNTIAVFLTPDTPLPDGAAAAIYLQLPGSPDFRFVGAVGKGKESAMFRVGAAVQTEGCPILGINLDSEAAIAELMAVNGIGRPASSSSPSSSSLTSVSASAAAAAMNSSTAQSRSPMSAGSSTALVPVPPGRGLSNNNNTNRPDTKTLAKRIIANAFNFLASYAGQVGGPAGGGEEVVPLRSFREWWVKFEKRIEMDPGFLERESEGGAV